MMGTIPHSNRNIFGRILSNMKIKQKTGLTFGHFTTAAWLARKNTMNVLVDRLKIGLAIAGLTALTGCIGFVGGGGDYGGGGWWRDDGGWWGGGARGYDRGHDVHGYSARGAASRGAAHGDGGHMGGGGHGGGGGRR